MNASTIAGHAVSFDSAGQLLPWTSWTAALDREMNFYQHCPSDHGYPRFAVVTFLDGQWNPHPDRDDTIPATQLRSRNQDSFGYSYQYREVEPFDR